MAIRKVILPISSLKHTCDSFILIPHVPNFEFSSQRKQLLATYPVQSFQNYISTRFPPILITISKFGSIFPNLSSQINSYYYAVPPISTITVLVAAPRLFLHFLCSCNIVLCTLDFLFCTRINKGWFQQNTSCGRHGVEQYLKLY